MSGKRFLKGFILRGRTRYCGRGLPLGEKTEGGHCGISPRITVAPRTFLFVRGGAAGRPLVFEEGWSSGRGGEGRRTTFLRRISLPDSIPIPLPY